MGAGVVDRVKLPFDVNERNGFWAVIDAQDLTGTDVDGGADSYECHGGSLDGIWDYCSGALLVRAAARNHRIDRANLAAASGPPRYLGA